MTKLLRDYLSVIFGSGFGRGLSFITALLLARSMAVNEFGFFSVFFTIMMLAWQISGIVDAVYVRYVKAGNEKKSDCLKTALVMKMSLFCIVCLLSYPLSYTLSTYAFRKPDLVLYLTAAFISGGCLSIFSSLGAIFQAQERFGRYSLVNILFYSLVFSIVGLAVVFKAHLSVKMAALVYSACAGLIGSIGIVYLYRMVAPVFPLRTGLFAGMFHFGKWLFADSILYIILQRIDLLFLARFVDYHELGIYSAAVRIAMFASIMTSAASAIFMPRGCESLQSFGKFKAYFREAIFASAGLTVMIACLIAIVPELIKHLFGAQYMGGVLATRILLVEAICVLLYTPFSFLFYASGNTRQVFIFGVIKLCVCAAGLVLLVPRFGPVGAAASIALSSLCGLIVAAAMSLKIIRYPDMYFEPPVFIDRGE